MVAATEPRIPTSKWAYVGLGSLSLLPLLPLPKGFEAFVAPLCLLSGVALAMTLGNPYPKESKALSKTLLQAAVVLLGFSLQFSQVVQAGSRGFLFSVVSISLVFALGFALSKMLKIRPVTSLLVSAGTAICGGSAIAAMSSAVDAPQEDVTVAVGTIFLLNSVALLIFPPLGHLMGLTGAQFGTWAGIAIHDVSSVVGAASAYGHDSLVTATAVKLSRVVFLIPATLVGTWLSRGQGKKVSIPWFVGMFILASLIHMVLPGADTMAPYAKTVATCGFALSLFLIGSGLSRTTLRAVGFRPLAQGAVLWLVISTLALVAARTF